MDNQLDFRSEHVSREEIRSLLTPVQNYNENYNENYKFFLIPITFSQAPHT